jgi:hypothetical protein
MRTGRTPAQIAAATPLPLAAGEVAKVELAAGQQLSAALEITDRVAAVAGQIARPAPAAGEAAVVAAVVAALAAGGNWETCVGHLLMFIGNSAVNDKVGALEEGNVAR